MPKRTLVALIALLALLGSVSGCGSDGGSDGDTGVDGEKSAAEEQEDRAERCDGFTAGEDDVIRTFCGGTAEVELTIGGDDHSLSGGECSTQGGYFSVNIGVVTGPDFTGTRPDYFGSNMPEAEGDYGDGDQAFATFAIDGTEYSVPDTTGSHDGETATFSGTTTDGGIEVSGTVTC